MSVLIRNEYVQKGVAMLDWRMKLRGMKEFWGGLFAAFVKEPAQSIKFVLMSPLLIFQTWVERGDDDLESPYMKACEEIHKQELRDFHKHIAQLPPHLHDFPRYFGKPKFSSNEVREIVSSVAAKELFALCPTLEKLAPYDLFHTHFFTVIHDTPMLFRSQIRHGQMHGDARITIGKFTKCVAISPGDSDMTAGRLSGHFNWILGCDGVKLENWNKGMWEWLFALLLARPYVLEGYEAQIDGEHLVLVPSTHIAKSNIAVDGRERLIELNKLRWETPR